MKDEEVMILFAIVIAIGKVLYDHKETLDLYTQKLLAILPSASNWKIYAIIALPFVIYLNYIINVWLSNWFNHIRYMKASANETRSTIERLATRSLDFDNKKELEAFTDEVNRYLDRLSTPHYRSFREFKKDLKIQLKNAKNLHEELRHKEEIEDLSHKERYLEHTIEELDKEKRKVEFYLEHSKEKKFQSMHPEDNHVFLKNNLTDEKIDLLLKHGYSYSNEYDIETGKIKTYLIKPPMKHSKEHTFVVWNLVEILSKMPEVSNIDVNDTVGADIEFTWEGETPAALEVETGTILYKKEQLQSKVSSHNKKFGQFWMFVVTNKNKIPKFRDYGRATTRKDFVKNLRKMMKSATQ